jgi:competence protein ComGB
MKDGWEGRRRLKIRRWNRAAQGNFLYKLGFMLENGYSINKSIELLKTQLPKNKQVLLDEMLEILDSGNSVIDVFTPLRLPNEIMISLSISSINGNLTRSLMENGTYMKKKTEWSNRLNKAMRYPLFLLFLTAWIGILFYQFLYPQFSLLFSSLGVETPAFTTWMLLFLRIIPTICLIIFILTIIALLVFYFLKKKANYSTQMNLFMRVPLINKFVLLTNSHFFSVNFGSMLKSGLPVSDALFVMETHLNNGFYKEESQRLQKGLLNGNTLPDLLLSKPYFTKELAEIVRYGQANGELGTELIAYGEWLFSELEEKIFSALQKIQPISFAVIGTFVLLMFASILFPMFKLMEAL